MAHKRYGIPTSKHDGATPIDVEWRDADGRKRSQRFYDEDAADRTIAEIEYKLSRGESTDPRAGNKTFKVVAEEWLATRTKARRETVDGYRAILERHILPTFARKRVGRITPTDIGRFVTVLSTRKNGRPRAPEGIKRICYPLRATLAYATNQGYIPRSPAAPGTVSLPDADDLGAEAFTATALTRAQVSEVATECEASGYPHASLLVRFAAYTGLRASELSGLRIRDVDLLHKRLVVRVKWSPKTGYGAPKSRRSKDRPVPLDSDPQTFEDFTAYLDNHPRKHDPDTPVFYRRDDHKNPDPSTPLDMGAFYKRTYKPAVRALGMPTLRFHDLRHTAGSLWLAAGIPLMVVSRWLGHASASFTADVYGHTYEDDMAGQVAKAQAYAEATDAAAQQSGKVRPLRKAQ